MAEATATRPLRRRRRGDHIVPPEEIRRRYDAGARAGAKPHQKQLERLQLLVGWLSRCCRNDGEAFLRSQPQIVSAWRRAGFDWRDVGGPKATHERFHRDVKRYLGYLKEMGYVVDWEPVYKPNGEGIGVRITVTADVAQLAVATRKRRRRGHGDFSSAPPRRRASISATFDPPFGVPPTTGPPVGPSGLRGPGSSVQSSTEEQSAERCGAYGRGARDSVDGRSEGASRDEGSGKAPGQREKDSSEWASAAADACRGRSPSAARRLAARLDRAWQRAVDGGYSTQLAERLRPELRRAQANGGRSWCRVRQCELEAIEDALNAGVINPPLWLELAQRAGAKPPPDRLPAWHKLEAMAAALGRELDLDLFPRLAAYVEADPPVIEKPLEDVRELVHELRNVLHDRRIR